MKVIDRNGWLYLEYYSPEKGHSTKDSLRLKATQENRRQKERELKQGLLRPRRMQLLKPDISGEMTLSLALKEFIAYNNYRPKTEEVYKQAVNIFITACGDRRLSLYTREDYIRLKDEFKKRKSSQNTQSVYTRALKHFFNYLLKEKYIKENFIQTVKSTEGNPSPIPPEHKEAILTELKRRGSKVYHLFKLLLNTGIRISTALELDWNDVSFEQREIKFKNIKVNNQPYIFPMTDMLLKILIEAGPPHAGKIFPYKDRHSLRIYRRVQKDLGFKTIYGIHRTKSTFISDMINAGISPSDLSAVTNTSLKTILKYYARFDIKRIGGELNEAQKRIAG